MADEENVAARENIEDGEGQSGSPSGDAWAESYETLNRSLPEWREVNAWIREHPEASVLGAAGVGVIVGTWMFSRSAPPPALSERMQAAAWEMGDEVRHRAEETGKNVSRAVSEQAEKASRDAADAAASAREAGWDAFNIVRAQARENPELTRMIANAAYTAAAALLVKKIGRWIER